MKVLQSAFVKALGDFELLAEAKKRRLDVDPVSGEELEALARDVMAQPPEVIEKMKQVLGS